MRTAAAYIRVSTDDQLEYSPDSQLLQIRRYAKDNGFLLPQQWVFVEEEGRSGRQSSKRPEFLRMIAAAKQSPKPFDAILVWKYSRFARSRQDSIVYKSMLRKELGIDVISVSEYLGDDKMAIITEAIIEAMDEFYSVNLAEEVTRGMAEKARRGQPLTYAPFGYRIEDKRYLPDPGHGAAGADDLRRLSGRDGLSGDRTEARHPAGAHPLWQPDGEPRCRLHPAKPRLCWKDSLEPPQQIPLCPLHPRRRPAPGACLPGGLGRRTKAHCPAQKPVPAKGKAVCQARLRIYAARAGAVQQLQRSAGPKRQQPAVQRLCPRPVHRLPLDSGAEARALGNRNAAGRPGRSCFFAASASTRPRCRPHRPAAGADCAGAKPVRARPQGL